MYEAYSDGVTLDLLLELCTEGSMADYVVSRTQALAGSKCYSRPDDFELARAMEQLLSAVEFLHQSFVAHRDIKPDNVPRLHAQGYERQPRE